MTELPDRLLRDALAAPAASPDQCGDADALAAWADGTMSGVERAAFESHAAGCARCQALMAAMIRTEPAPDAPAARRRALFAWLIPLATATAALVVVVALAVSERRAQGPQLARVEPATVVPPRAEDKVEPNAGSAPAPGSAASAAAAPTVAVPSRPDAQHDAQPGALPGAQRERDAAKPRAVQPRDERTETGALPAAKPEPLARQAEPAGEVRALPAAPAPQPSAAAASPTAAPPPPTAAPSAAAKAIAPPTAAAAEPVSADSARAPGVSSRLEAAAARPFTNGPVLIPSPARESQWRIAGGRVERTEDGGGTWQRQTLGVDLPVRAGSAPAPRVCWLAGARGLVLLTTDAVHWRRIAFPEATDLVGIEAADETHAIVTTAAGGRFATADGGATWTARK